MTKQFLLTIVAALALSTSTNAFGVPSRPAFALKSTASDDITDGLKQGKEQAQSKVDAAASNVQDAAGSVKDAAGYATSNEASDKVIGTANQGLKDAQSNVNSVIEDVKDAAGKAADGIKNTIDSAGDVIKENQPQLNDNTSVDAKVDQVVGSAKQTASEAHEQAKGN